MSVSEDWDVTHHWRQPKVESSGVHRPRRDAGPVPAGRTGENVEGVEMHDGLDPASGGTRFVRSMA